MGEGAKTAEYNAGGELADLGGHGEDGRRPPDCLLHNLGPPQRQLEILLRPSSLLLPALTNSLSVRPYLPTSPIPLEVALPPLLSLPSLLFFFCPSIAVEYSGAELAGDGSLVLALSLCARPTRRCQSVRAGRRDREVGVESGTAISSSVLSPLAPFSPSSVTVQGRATEPPSSSASPHEQRAPSILCSSDQTGPPAERRICSICSLDSFCFPPRSGRRAGQPPPPRRPREHCHKEREGASERRGGGGRRRGGAAQAG